MKLNPINYENKKIKILVNNMGKKILIVDDAKFMRNILRKILEGDGYTIIGEAETADEGIKLYSEKKPDFFSLFKTLFERL